MCFSPQRRAMLRQPTFEKCSEEYSFLTFSLQNVLFATAACNFLTAEIQTVLRNVSFWAFSLPSVLFATAACIFSTSELQKVLPPWRVLSIFISKCAVRHSGVHFFDIWTSKNAPTMRCFEHFHFKMCLSPQRRAIFDFFAEHLPPRPPL